MKKNKYFIPQKGKAPTTIHRINSRTLVSLRYNVLNCFIMI